MYMSSTEYKEKMAGLLRPAMNVEVEYGQVDPNARDNATVSRVSVETMFSNKNQTLNDRRLKPTVKIATLEGGGFPLDGTFELTPTSPPDYEVGYRPSTLSDENGNIDIIYEVSTVDINAVGISILFEPLLNEWAVDFDITFGSITKQIRGNTDVFWVSDFAVTNATSVALHILKWSKPYTRAKIQQFEFGIYVNYDIDRLTALTATNRTNLIAESLSENELVFKFTNINKEYDPMALIGREKFVEDRQPITLRAGYTGEMFDIGYYETVGTPSISLSEVEVTATSLVKRLDKDIETKFYQNTSLYNIAVDMLNYCKIVNYRIDESLKTISVTSIVSGNCREIMTDIMIASMTSWWFELDTFVIGKHPVIDTGYVIDKTICEAPEIKFRDKISKITCTGMSYSVDTSASEVGSLHVDKSGTYKFNIDNCLNVSVSGGTLKNSGIDYVEVTTTGAIEITASGKKINQTELTFEQTLSDTGDEIEIDNKLINNETMANNVINHVVAYKNRRHEFDTTWRQDPVVQVGDVIQLDTDFGRYKCQVEEQYFDMSDGGLKGSTKAVIMLE